MLFDCSKLCIYCFIFYQIYETSSIQQCAEKCKEESSFVCKVSIIYLGKYKILVSGQIKINMEIISVAEAQYIKYYTQYVYRYV